ncbi:hypothetical protein EV401DRAFT_1031756 [Pisolithus croceorrhizus]|nr:hypothetical protein EV401DRAFT_1031756 [Pisolithus croceorrhizus]
MGQKSSLGQNRLICHVTGVIDCRPWNSSTRANNPVKRYKPVHVALSLLITTSCSHSYTKCLSIKTAQIPTPISVPTTTLQVINTISRTTHPRTLPSRLEISLQGKVDPGTKGLVDKRSRLIVRRRILVRRTQTTVRIKGGRSEMEKPSVVSSVMRRIWYSLRETQDTKNPTLRWFREL